VELPLKVVKLVLKVKHGLYTCHNLDGSIQRSLEPCVPFEAVLNVGFAWNCFAADWSSNGSLHHNSDHHSFVADSTPEPSTSQPASQARPQVVVLLCVAQQMLLEQSKALDTARMAAFTKSLTCAALHLESGAAMRSLSLVNRLLR